MRPDSQLQGCRWIFGTKRTGDLMTRVSTDSDRICNFISMNVVDFMSDVLMITGTACILIAMNQKLALITLIPIPFVAWLSAWIRDRLKQAFRHGGVIWAEMTSILADTIPGFGWSKPLRRRPWKSNASRR
jgi:ATP-binding cassette subfamily B protein